MSMLILQFRQLKLQDDQSHCQCMSPCCSHFMHAEGMPFVRCSHTRGAVQATITDAAHADGRKDPCGLHALKADFDARQLLALLTPEYAHSTNLWMQQRCFAYPPCAPIGENRTIPFPPGS